MTKLAKHRKKSDRGVVAPAFVTTGVAGAAMVGASFLLATTDTAHPVAAPAVELTTSQCSLGSAFCTDLGLVSGTGSATSKGVTASASAAATGGDVIAIFISNGTADHPERRSADR